ncbi:MAG: TRAP transporter small permease subunit [Pseudomonadota bacterium]
MRYLGGLLIALGVIGLLLSIAGLNLGPIDWLQSQLGVLAGWAVLIGFVIFGIAFAPLGNTPLTLDIAQYFDWPAREVGKLTGWLIIPLILIIMFDVVTRKIDAARIWIAEQNIFWFNPIIFQDAQWHLHGVILLCSFGFGYLMNAHVRVDIFREMLPRRGQAKVEFWGLLIMGIPFLMIISYFALQFVGLSVSQNEQSESLTGIGNRYIVKSFLIVGFVLLLFSFIATIMRLFAAIWGPVEHRETAYATLDIFADDVVKEDFGTVTSDITSQKDNT